MKSKIALILVLFVFSVHLNGQIIGIKTIPSITNEHLFTHPSYKSAMGDISIAVDDELVDVYINPAKVFGRSRTFLCFMPSRNNWSTLQNGADDVPGRDLISSEISSLPLGFLDYDDGIFSGISVEYQWLRNRQQGFTNRGFHIPLTTILGFEVIEDRLALGGGVGIIVVEGIDGYNLLYPGSSSLRFRGTLSTYRIGVAGRLSSRDDYSIVGLYHGYNVEEVARFTEEEITYENRNHGWAWMAEYRHMLSRNIRAGIQLAGNWKTPAAIPNYPLSDSEVEDLSGSVRAFDLGIGLSWKNETTRLGLDLVYEPVDLKMFWEVPRPIWVNLFGKRKRLQTSQLLYAYTFYNRIVRFGMETQLSDVVKVRFGVNSKIYEYEFNHRDSAGSARLKNQWNEVVLTAGASVSFGRFELLPCFRMINGTGIVSSTPGPNVTIDEDDRASSFATGWVPDIITIIPQEDLSLKPVPVFAFQMSIVYWISL